MNEQMKKQSKAIDRRNINRGRVTVNGMSIRNDVPAPPNTQRTKYPFYEMEVGDCLELTPEHPGARENRGGTCSAQSSAHSYARNHGVKFRTMIVKDDPDTVDGTVRIWRVE